MDYEQQRADCHSRGLMWVDPRGNWDEREAWLLLDPDEYDRVMDEESARQMREANDKR